LQRPNQSKICSINPRSVNNKSLAISDYIVTNDFDIVAITETWLGTTNIKTVLAELVPEGYKICQVSRSGHGGGVAVIHKASIDLELLESSRTASYDTFEYRDCSLAIKNYSLRLIVIYRPPPNKTNGIKAGTFLENELPKFLSQLATVNQNIVVVGDLNFHLDNPSNTETAKLNGMLQSFGMRQHVNEPTHTAGHTLDVVITRDTDDTVTDIVVSDPGFPDCSGNTSRDHYAVQFNASAAKPAPIRKLFQFRKQKSICVNDFKNDTMSSNLTNCVITNTDAEKLVDIYNDELALLLDKHAPLLTKTIVLRPSCP